LTDFLGYRIGFPDHSKPYEITCLERETTIGRLTFHQPAAVYEFTTRWEINIFTKRLSRDNVDPQLGNMEREVQRIICQFKSGDIPGVRDLIYQGQERIYTSNDNWASSEWRSRVSVLMKYEVQGE